MCLYFGIPDKFLSLCQSCFFINSSKVSFEPFLLSAGHLVTTLTIFHGKCEIEVQPINQIRN